VGVVNDECSECRVEMLLPLSQMNLLDLLVEFLYANCNIYMLMPRNLGGMASAKTFDHSYTMYEDTDTGTRMRKMRSFAQKYSGDRVRCAG
jgi:hypothetical protein